MGNPPARGIAGLGWRGFVAREGFPEGEYVACKFWVARRWYCGVGLAVEFVVSS